MRSTTEKTHPCHLKGLELNEGDRVLFNDRSRPLTVVGSHTRKNSSTYYGDDEYRVVELDGNGTEYHLLALRGATHGPMLYREANWDDDQTNDYGESPRYSRMGERVESIEVASPNDTYNEATGGDSDG